jgi:hypothetical protein
MVDRPYRHSVTLFDAKRHKRSARTTTELVQLGIADIAAIVANSGCLSIALCRSREFRKQ